MNKVFNINLGGYPFTIDQDAYEHLNNYLDTIHHHFETSEGYEEITADIEARMAELFQDHLEGRSIVTMKDVKNAISIMGTPEDFGAESYEKEQASGRNWEEPVIKTGKRLFRNPEDEVVGGVCSGVAAYFGIEDPVWVRLAMVLFTISGGLGIPLYIVLWAILPKAETSADRLAMRGEPINVSNIAKTIETEIENLSEKLSDFGSGPSKKKRDGGIGDERNALSKGVSLLGKIFSVVVSTLLRIWKPIIFIIGFTLIIVLTVIWILSVISFFFAAPYSHYLFAQSHLPSLLGITNLFVIIGVPILSLMLFAARLMFRTRIKKPVRIGMWTFWVLNVVSLFGLLSFLASQFNQSNSVDVPISLQQIDSDTLILNMREGHNRDVLFSMGALQIEEQGLSSEQIELDIIQGESDKFVFTQKNKARGATAKQASQFAGQINYQIEVADNKLTLPGLFFIDKESQWRNQHVVLTLEVPVGKTVLYDRGVRNKIHHISIDRNRQYPSPIHDNYWKMEENGLVCFDYLDKINQSKEMQYSNFEDVYIEGLMKVIIQRGDDYQLRITGREDYTRKVEIIQSGRALHIESGLSKTQSPVRLYLTMPALKSIYSENTDDIKIEGFKEARMNITHEGRHDIKALVDVDSLSIRQTGRNEIDIRGSGKFLKATLDDHSRLDAEHFAVDDAIVKATNRSVIKVAAARSITGEKSPGSKVVNVGEPALVSIKDLQ